MNGVKITTKSVGLILVLSQFNEVWVKRAKKLGGKWDSTNKGWVFNEELKPEVSSALKEIYGTDGEPTSDSEKVKIRIKSTRELSYTHGAVDFLGFTIARASGRDSGARLGENVALISGRVGSGGSVKNWMTYCQSGSEFMICSFPKALLDREDDRWEIMEIIQTKSELDSLKDEREKLLNRLAEVEKLIREKESV